MLIRASDWAYRGPEGRRMHMGCAQHALELATIFDDPPLRRNRALLSPAEWSILADNSVREFCPIR